jgi:Mg/Co/Ni transporter MgtE
MPKKKKQSINRWFGLILLIVFGALVGSVFSYFQDKVIASIAALAIAIAFVIITKLAGIEPGWPKN